MKIFEAITGSRAYGLATVDSDTDRRAIYVRPFIDLLSIYGTGTGHIADATQDKQEFELRHFIFLLSKSNPNALELLWSEPEMIFLQEPPMNELIVMNEELITKQVAETFGNYALAQMNRICGHCKKLMNPQPVEKPKLRDYVTFEKNNGYKAPQDELDTALQNLICTKVSNGKFKAWQTSFNGQGLLSTQDDRPVYYNFSKQQLQQHEAIFQGWMFIQWDAYDKAVNDWARYWTWKENRSEARKKLEEQYGFDCKHAMHLIRLLEMAAEALQTQELHIKRPNRDELLAIRNGSLSYEEMIALADAKFKAIKKLANESNLPERPDSRKLQAVYESMVTKVWGLSWVP